VPPPLQGHLRQMLHLGPPTAELTAGHGCRLHDREVLPLPGSSEGRKGKASFGGTVLKSLL
jgi:hypothetical protein